MKTATRKESGFTIIEVVLVLAIAGLIFLVVFLALPALQRSQRDSQRRQDASRMLAQLETYASNNQGDYPTTTEIVQTGTGEFVNEYLRADGSVFADPTGNDYTITAFSTGSDPTVQADPDGDMYYGYEAICGSEGDFEPGSGDRQIAVMVPLENGIAYCQDNR